jgi:hypothetical protein
MYQFEIKNTIEEMKTVVIANGEQFLDREGFLIFFIDENEVEQPLLNESGEDIDIEIKKTPEEIAAEEQALIDAKTAEVQTKVDVYIAAQQAQLQNGGPGPVADVEIMTIVNEHNGQFEVVFKEAGE